jgi:hypothetical protein
VSIYFRWGGGGDIVAMQTGGVLRAGMIRALVPLGGAFVSDSLCTTSAQLFAQLGFTVGHIFAQSNPVRFEVVRIRAYPKSVRFQVVASRSQSNPVRLQVVASRGEIGLCKESPQKEEPSVA